MSNELINYDDGKVIQTLKETVAKDASPSEFAMFMQYCKSTGLNPFRKELWFIKAGGRVQIMTGVAGYLAIANSHNQFDGMTVDVEVDKEGWPIKAIAQVFRKDRKYPSVGIALMREYRKDTPIWKQMPSVMLTKVAKSIALREAFPQELNGLYTEEEMPPEYSKGAIETKATRELSETAQRSLAQGEKGTIGFPEQPKQLHYYNIPAITKEQSLFMQKHAEYDGEKDIWISSNDLGPKLAAYKFDPEKAKLDQVMEGDDLPSEYTDIEELPMGEVVEAPKPTKVQELQAKLALKNQSIRNQEA